MTTFRIASVVVNGELYMVHWPAGMDREMEMALDERINCEGAWQCKPGIMLISAALQVAYEERLAEAVQYERT